MIVQSLEKIKKVIHSPSVIFIGSPLTGLIKLIDSVLSIHETSLNLEESREEVINNGYPDINIYDGRETKVEVFRSVRQDSTVLPSIWSRKYFVVTYFDRIHYSVPHILLKLIEEPPSHLSVFMLTDNIKKIPETICSRSLVIQTGYSNQREVIWWLEYKEKDEIEIRSNYCGGDLDVAENIEISILKNWITHWSAFLIGVDLPVFFTDFWIEKLEEVNEPTILSLWIYLGKMIQDKLITHTLWRDLGLLILEAKECVISGNNNKINLSTFIIRAYALAVTINNRVKT